MYFKLLLRWVEFSAPRNFLDAYWHVFLFFQVYLVQKFYSWFFLPLKILHYATVRHRRYVIDKHRCVGCLCRTIELCTTVRRRRYVIDKHRSVGCSCRTVVHYATVWRRRVCQYSLQDMSTLTPGHVNTQWGGVEHPVSTRHFTCFTCKICKDSVHLKEGMSYWESERVYFP